MRMLRAEARATLHALLLLLLIPVLHPVAEARALENGTASVICSTFGDADADPLAQADDLPDCVACAIASVALPAADAATGVPALLSGLAWRAAPHPVLIAGATLHGPSARGPPLLG
jgi:hypothetical protein